MKEQLLSLYKVSWKHTAIKYVVAQTNDVIKIREMVRKNDGRCDDIVNVEKVNLPSFDNDVVRKEDCISIFIDLNIL